MNNVALITGASSGIGKELAHIHAEHGGDLVIVARGKPDLEKLKAELEEKHRVHVMIIVQDLTTPTAAQEIYDRMQQEDITVSHLINNAGFGGQGAFHDRDWVVDRAMIQLNVIAVSELCHLFLPDFIQRQHGKILNVSSTASFMPGPFQAVYYATKAYVRSFTNAIAEEVREHNITVTNLMPGPTATGFAKRADLESTSLFAQTSSARSVAEAGYRGMLQGKLDVIAGVSFSLRVVLMLLPLIPKKLLLKQVRGMQEVK